MNQKTVLITGCSSGIGYLSALKFAHNGYYTYASVRNINSEGADKLQEIASIENLPLEVIKIDVDNDQSVREGTAYVINKSKKIDTLVNNAGFGFIGPVEDFQLDEIREQFNTNVFGVVRMIKQVIPVMRENGSGRIINVSSISGLQNFPLYGIYCASKHALESISEALSFELAPFNIQVVCIEPGSFNTGFSRNKKISGKSKTNESPYRELLNKFSGRYEKAINSSQILIKTTDPVRVADRIFAVAEAKNPKLHNVIGWDAHLYLFLKQAIPHSLWRFLIRKVYNW